MKVLPARFSLLPKAVVAISLALMLSGTEGSAKNGIILYIDAENGLKPAMKTESSSDLSQKRTDALISQGKFGQGIQVKKGGRIECSLFGESPGRGSVSFWIRPEPLQKTDISKNLYLLNMNPHICIMKRQPGRIHMTSWIHKKTGKGYNIFPSVKKPSDWNDGKWHFVVATWQNTAEGMKYGLYWDCKAIIEGVSKNNEIRTGSKRRVLFGYPGVYDDIAFWSVPLSKTQIDSIYQTGKPLSNGVLQNRTREKKKLIKCASIKTNSSDECYFRGNEIDICASFATSPKYRGDGFKYECRIIDYYGNTVKTIRGNSYAGESGQIEIGIRFTPQKYGIFKIRYIIEHEKQREVSFDDERISVSVLPEELYKRGRMPDSRYGLKPYYSLHRSRYLGYLKKMGLKWFQEDGETRWYRFEPEAGAYKERLIRRGLFELWNKYDLELASQLSITPAWASRMPGSKKISKHWTYGYYPPKDMLLINKYSYKIAETYKDRIRYWEFWNEPHVQFWKGSPEEYVAGLKQAWKGIKEVDPGIKVIGGGGLSWWFYDWIERALKAGMLDYCDIISIHNYQREDKTLSDEKQLNRWDKFIALLEKYGWKNGIYKGRNIPIWSTEVHCYGTSFLKPLQPKNPDMRMKYSYTIAASKAPRGTCRAVATGVKRLFYYSIAPRPWSWGMKNPMVFNLNEVRSPEGGGGLLPDGVALGITAWLLDEAALYKRLCIGEHAVAYVFSPRTPLHIDGNEFDAITVLYLRDINLQRKFCSGLKMRVPLSGKKTLALNIMGNPESVDSDPSGMNIPVSGEPIYLLSTSGPEQSAKAFSKARLIPGDRTVSNILKKLHNGGVRDISKTGIIRRSRPDSDFTLSPTEKNKLFTVDLRKYANRGFSDKVPGDGKGGWTDQGDMNDMRDMPLGRQNFLGIPFDIINPAKNGDKSAIILYGSQTTPGCQTEVKNIMVGRFTKKLFFLLTASYAMPGKHIGDLKINLEDGSSQAIPLVVNRNIDDWWNKAATTDKSRLVPIGVTKNGAKKFRYLRVLEWSNPTALMVHSIDFKSKKSIATPILIAVSGIEK